MRLRSLLGDHPGTAALKNGSVRSDLVEFDFVSYSTYLAGVQSTGAALGWPTSFSRRANSNRSQAF